MDLPKIQNLQISTPLTLLRKKVELFEQNGGEMVGYLDWCLKHLSQNSKLDMEQLQEILRTDDILMWTVGGQFEELVLVELIAIKMNIAFLHILAENAHASSESIASAHATIERVEKLLNTKPKHSSSSSSSLTYDLKHPDHISGIKIILESLKVLKALQFDEAVSSSVTLNLVKGKEKAVSKIIEARFVFEFLTDKEKYGKEFQLVKDAAILDPDEWEWQVMRSRQFRWERQKQNLYEIDMDEQNAMRKALDMNPNHPWVQLCNCEALLQILNNNNTSRGRYSGNPFRLHGFNSRSEVVAHIREKAEQFKEQYPAPSWMFSFAKMFGGQLRKDSDLRFSVGLLNKGLEVGPDSSKLNHRKAIILAKLGMYKEAETCIRIAVKNGRNMPAILDMAKLLLRKSDLSPVEDELKELFSDEQFQHLNNTKPPPPAVVEALFLKGYFFMKLNDPETAIQTWLDWVPLYNSYLIQKKNQVKFNFSEYELRSLKDWGWQFGSTFANFVQNVRQALRNFVRDHPGQRKVEVGLLEKFLSG